MMAQWPFAQWGLDILGLDILGPFPIGTRQMKFLVVGIDYFTKWVEAEPLVNHTTECKEFRLEKYCVQVWGALSANVRQWTTI